MHWIKEKKISVKSHEFWRLFVLGHIKIVTLTSIYNVSYISMCEWAEGGGGKNSLLENDVTQNCQISTKTPNRENYNKEKKHHIKKETLPQESNAPKDPTKLPIILQETVLGFTVLDINLL